MEGEAQLILALCGVVAAIASMVYWRQATFAAMVLLVFEGALRKWVLPEAQAALYLAKDVVLLGAYVGFAAYKAPRVRIPHGGVLMAILAATAIYGAGQVFNPALPTTTLGLVGWRAYFFYIPLLFVVPHLFESLEELYAALRRFSYLAIPIALLGLLQFYSPADSPINMNVQHDEGGGAALGFGSVNRVRVAGTFSFVSGFAAYLLAMAMAIAASLAVARWRVRGNAALYAGLALVIAAMLATGSRAPVYSLAIVAVLGAIVSVLMGEIAPARAMKAALSAIVLVAAMAYFLPEPAEAFRSRASGSDDAVSRVLSPLVEPFIILGEAGPMGFGIGAAHQSAHFITGSAYPWWTDGMTAEAETSKITLETGFLGITLVLLFRIGIALAALQACFSLRSRGARILALAIALFLGLQVMGSVIFNPTMNLLYWFAAGLIFALYRLDARVVAAARQVEVASLDRLARPAGARRFTSS